MYLDLLFRWIHILSALVLVGGTFFLRFSLVPAAASLGGDVQRSLLDAWRPRWARLVMLSSGLLLLTGLVNAVRIILGYEFPNSPYHALVAVKLLIALAIFWISAVLAGRSELAQKFREKMSFWLTVNVILALLIVGLASYMKMVDRTPKLPETAGSLVPVAVKR